MWGGGDMEVIQLPLNHVLYIYSTEAEFLDEIQAKRKEFSSLLVTVTSTA